LQSLPAAFPSASRNKKRKKKKEKTETRAELFFPELNGVVHLPKHVIKQITVIVTTTNPRR
jgi:hypothetical protein